MLSVRVPKPRTARLGKPGAGLWGPARACRGFGAQPRFGKAVLDNLPER